VCSPGNKEVLSSINLPWRTERRCRVLASVPTLVSVRKDLVAKRSFTLTNCFPVRGKYLSISKKINFANLWGAENGKKSSVEMVKNSRWPVGEGPRGGGIFGGGCGAAGHGQPLVGRRGVVVDPPNTGA
jgi:hypothetical protein